jgi:hypothetical protein
MNIKKKIKKDTKATRREKVLEFLEELRYSGKLHGVEFGYVDDLIKDLKERL